MRKQKKTCLIVDGYNVICNVPKMKKLMKPNQEDARKELADRLQNFAGAKGIDELIVVYDGKTHGKAAEEISHHKSFKEVFTSKLQTADSYIEKFAHDYNEKYRNIYVITSDGAVQSQILGSNALRVSVREFMAEEKNMQEEAKISAREKRRTDNTRDDFSNRLDPSVKELWDQLRRNGK